MAGASASAKRSKPRGCPPKRKERAGVLAKGVSANGGTSIATQASLKSASAKSDKYVHVHEYLYTGRWGTWFNDPRCSDPREQREQTGCRKRRLYFGTYETEYLAARAQDRAALMFKPFSVKSKFELNFAETDYELDRELRDKLEPDQFRRLLMGESRQCYNRKAPSPCFWKFLEEERTKKNLSADPGGRDPKQPRTNAEILSNVAELNKNPPVVSTVATTQAEENWDSSREDDEGQVGSVKRTKRLTRVRPREHQPAGSLADTLATTQERSPRARPVRQGGVPRVQGKSPTKSCSSSQMNTVTRRRLAWEKTSPRSTREKLRLARAARDAAAEEQQRKNMLMLVCIVSLVTDGSSNAPVETRGNERTVLAPNTHGRLVIDLNCVPEDLSMTDSVEPPYEAGAGSSEEMSAHTLLTMMKLF